MAQCWGYFINERFWICEGEKLGKRTKITNMRGKSHFHTSGEDKTTRKREGWIFRATMLWNLILIFWISSFAIPDQALHLTSVPVFLFYPGVQQNQECLRFLLNVRQNQLVLWGSFVFAVCGYSWFVPLLDKHVFAFVRNCLTWKKARNKQISKNTDSSYFHLIVFKGWLISPIVLYVMTQVKWKI